MHQRKHFMKGTKEKKKIVQWEECKMEGPFWKVFLICTNDYGHGKLRMHQICKFVILSDSLKLFNEHGMVRK